ncbi:Phosphatidylserine decarboxylase proenzyme [Serratia fonticola]|uniref:Phosphatidylserine decarboxylase proenzyme n=1 Tax=Serratia fonticola TaxID=47917 RepID=A0A4U9VX28_SERFO|nr:Phosphatidylserine decarboxylase proenzyme [Serratia fonticola]
MLDSIKIKLQYWLPKLALTRLAGWGADKKAGWADEAGGKSVCPLLPRADAGSTETRILASYATFK